LITTGVEGVSVGGRLDGKSIIVTGAGSGFGRAAALRFAAEGAKLICTDIDPSAVEQTAEQVRSAGGVVVSMRADITSESDCEASAHAATDHYGGVDGLFANAGVEGPGSAEDCTLEQWRRVIDIDLTGAWLSAKAVLPAMRAQQRGSIVLTGSVAGLVGFPAGAAYAAAKGGVIALARQMTADYARDGIRVNALCPGSVMTPLVERLYAARASREGSDADALIKQTTDRYPLRRLGAVDEIVNTALFLLSDEASFVAGTAAIVDGGLVAV
jgi:NAD(P)-dependent dehydrogenase (short-subunit alcohol dehydrogenase family)